MRKKKSQKWNLCVSEEALEDFQKLTATQRITWLDEMRTFLSQTLDPETKKIFDEIRQG